MPWNFQLTKSEYYAPHPLFRLNNNTEIIDSNLLAQVLFQRVGKVQLGNAIRAAVQDCQNASSPPTPSPAHFIREAAVYTTLVSLAAGPGNNVRSVKALVLCIPVVNRVSDYPAQFTVFFTDNVFEIIDELRADYDSQVQSQLTWEKYAISYDIILGVQDYYRDVVRRHIEAFSAPEINRIIDLGAGTGNVAIPLLNVGITVTAIDFSRAMLDKMHSKLTDVEHTQLRIYQHSAEDLSVFNDGFFDGVNILLALFDMQNPKKALDEAIRVLKPTGIMVITEPKRTFDMNYLLREGQKFLERKGLYRSLASHWNCVMEVNRKIDPSTRNPLFIEDIENILNGQGIEVLRVVDSHFGQCSTLWAIKPNKPQQ